MEGEVALVFLGQGARGGHGCVLKVTSPPIWLEQRPPVKKWRESKNVTEARAQRAECLGQLASVQFERTGRQLKPQSLEAAGMA